MNIQIDSSDKIIAAENHRKLVLALQQNHSENILIYSDGSKQINCAGAGAYISSSIDRQQSCYWHLNSTVEAFDTELFAMFKSLQQAKAHVNSLTKNIWIFSDNQAAIQRISNSSCSSGQEISYKMQCEAESLLSQNIQLHICWIPSHVDIYGNEQADKAAKIAAAAVSTGFDDNIIDCSSESSISLTYLKSQVKKSLLKSWYNHYNSVKTNKGATYQNLNIQPAWKSLNLQLKTSRIVWSSYIQLKLGHGHFKSYLKRLSDYNSDKCDCNNSYVQSPAHLLTSCSKYQAEYSKIKEKLSVTDNLSLKLLFTTREEICAVFNFLKETKIARRNWLSD
jgi:ribonuclease HI